MSVRILGPVLRRSLYSGTGQISGTVTSDGTPAVRLVRLYHQKNGSLLEEQWSTQDGHYAFIGLSRAVTFSTIAHDHTGQFDPAAKSELIPEPMP